MSTSPSLVSLAGLWEFAYLGKIPVETADPLTVSCPEKMPVPAAFDALPAHAGKLGLAVYKKSVNVPAGRRARLEFGAVSRWSRIFVDGVLLKEHSSAYSPFEVMLPPAEHERREIVVLVNNRFDFERAPLNLEYFDWYQYGGIIRDVFLRILPEENVWIDAVRVTPDAETYREGGVTIEVDLGGEIGSAAGLTFQFDDAGEIFPGVPDAAGCCRQMLRVPEPRVWSPDSPNLHSVRVGIHTPVGHKIDQRIIRFGLRRIEAADGKLWLNGQPLQIRGFNRHDWHPNFGPSTPVLLMAADLQILKGMGCNFIRVHYPQDQKFLDLCDGLGFLVWEELNGGLPRESYGTPKFLEDHDSAIRAMIRASYNHPCVIIWGFLNESASHQEFSRPVYETIVRTIRSLDPGRLVSYASNHALEDRHLDLIDVISLNLYPGWYPGWGDNGDVDEPLELILPCLRKCLEHYSAPEWKEKPLVVTEIGAEAIYGWRDPHNDYFTEEYQARLLERACLELLSHPRSSGVVVWQFSDMRTWSGSRSMTRPRTFNNKGVFDEYRRPKAAAAVVGKIFQQFSLRFPSETKSITE